MPHADTDDRATRAATPKMPPKAEQVQANRAVIAAKLETFIAGDAPTVTLDRADALAVLMTIAAAGTHRSTRTF